MSALTITALGTPAPKGSLRHVGHGRLVEQVKGSKPWRELVAKAARDAGHEARWTTTFLPVHVAITVTVLRPKSAPKRQYPTTRSSGDIDKHSRNVLDALVDGAVIGDDSQVVGLAVLKVYGVEAGALINVTEVTP